MIALSEGSEAVRLFVTQLLGFLILVFILWKFAWRHIVNIFRSRSEEIARKVEDSDRGLAETKGEIEKYAKQVEGIDEEAQARFAKADKEARASSDGLLQQARQAADHIKDRASREVTLERDKALLVLRQESVRLTLLAAEALVDRAMDDATHRAMIDGYIRDLDKAAKE